MGSGNPFFMGGGPIMIEDYLGMKFQKADVFNSKDEEEEEQRRLEGEEFELLQREEAERETRVGSSSLEEGSKIREAAQE